MMRLKAWYWKTKYSFVKKGKRKLNENCYSNVWKSKAHDG